MAVVPALAWSVVVPLTVSPTWMHNFGHMAGGVAMLCRSFGHAVTVPMKRRYPQTDCKGVGGKEISWEGDNARLVSDKNPAEVHHRPQAYARRCICMQAQGVARSLMDATVKAHLDAIVKARVRYV